MSRTAICLLLLGFVSASTAGAQTVVRRARVGHSVEDITTFKGDVVALDGYEVFRYGKKQPNKLFDLRDVGIESHTTGMAFIESERLFAFVQPLLSDRMVLADSAGRTAGTRAIVYPAGFVPTHTEALAYLHSGPYRGHLALVAYEDLPTTLPRIEILKRDGHVVREVLPAALRDGAHFVAGVSGFGDNLLVTVIPNELWVIDTDGNVVAGPVVFPDAYGSEGVAQLRDGTVAASDYFSGKIRIFDGTLQRTPREDLANVFDARLTMTGGGGALAWNPESGRLLATAQPGNDSSPGRSVFSIVPALDDAAPFAHPASAGLATTRGLGFLPDEGKTAVGNRNPNLIALFDRQGRHVESINIDVASVGRIAGLAYLPNTREFALRVDALPDTLRIVSRTGALVRDIDLGGAGIGSIGAFAYFDPTHPSGGQFLVHNAGTGQLVRVDMNGTALASYEFKNTLGVLLVSGLSAITTGTWAGHFALVDNSNDEVVVFSLP